jgi:molybdopterin converting factor small subunit
MAKVTIPVQYRKLADNEPYYKSGSERVIDIIEDLVGVYPRLRPLLFDVSGALRSTVLYFVDRKDIRTLHGADTPVSETATLSIVPAIAGG